MAQGSGTQLFLLAELERRKEAHGHILLEAATVEADGIPTVARARSVYSTLGMLAAKGYVRVVRAEREGRRPVRTVYAITPAGERELTRLRDAALRTVAVAADPFDLAWSLSSALPLAVLIGVIEGRIHELTDMAEALENRNAGADTVDYRPYAHVVARVCADLEFHRRLLTALINDNRSRNLSDT